MMSTSPSEPSVSGSWGTGQAKGKAWLDCGSVQFPSVSILYIQ